MQRKKVEKTAQQKKTRSSIIVYALSLFFTLSLSQTSRVCVSVADG